MGKVFAGVTAKQVEWMRSVKVFFVATAPTSVEHRVNVSPRSPGTSCVFTGPTTMYWGDLSGSGCETAAHVLENGRMTLLFVNIEDGPPMIIRLHGTAKIYLPKEVDPEILKALPESLTTNKGFRCVYKLEANRITTSCGYSMPVMAFQKYRSVLDDFVENKDMDKYRELYNGFSIDGLPSLNLLHDTATGLGPSMEEGYIVSRPLSAADLGGKVMAKKRHATVKDSPARNLNGSRKTKAKPSILTSTLATHSIAFLLGALSVCVVAKTRGGGGAR
mmetsp:Transcript_21193/g.68367  ORF Transcript_21193/g.68367 Transcript_21193/m.68367 type:complete len:276 (+) Transcript_21193:118-945(+)